jgi:hypothetical protein
MMMVATMVKVNFFFFFCRTKIQGFERNATQILIRRMIGNGAVDIFSELKTFGALIGMSGFPAMFLVMVEGVGQGFLILEVVTC